MVDGVGVHGADDGDVVDDLGGPRKEFAHPGAALAVLGKREDRGGHGKIGLAAGHGGDALAQPDRVGQFLLETRLKRGLVVERVELRRPAVHVEIDNPLGRRREMGEAAERGKQPRGRRGSGAETRGEEVESDAAHGEASAGEELAAREMVQAGVGGIHGAALSCG